MPFDPDSGATTSGPASPIIATVGLVFSHVDGRPLVPSTISKAFVRLSAAAGVRRIRLLDPRHGSASLMLAAGVPVEIVSKRLGQASIAITMDIYSHLLEASAATRPRRPPPWCLADLAGPTVPTF
ncbi:tyrosine-type recombinase/integrase [Aeromicrobium fastidiosum]|uniref:tyrosine-type recombinase/integrase n=1 Tax=Aeromicrobium fastidiosum TaxID=52699 RepID=UPI001AE1165D|nr:tyrosine-type recombinase/integrase [Aeromicrobium fastidiosum]MBP2389369.1 integrase [Aeromicrobium fastidiosum]